MAMRDLHLEQRLEQVAVAITSRDGTYRELRDGNHRPRDTWGDTYTIILLGFSHGQHLTTASFEFRCTNPPTPFFAVFEVHKSPFDFDSGT